MELFEELDNLPIDRSSHGSFNALNPIKYLSIGEGEYHCSTCPRRWNSINSLVEFEYRLSKNRRGKPIGSVKVNLNGQKCKGI